ncbi:hypothetical protein niasHS_000639 [Heterodera schachtii]|uniref:Phosphoribosyltransferase domain-containing protein n=1 Tax=Heterodera schachtii TaxID=97005 RepID=A0ABD2K4U4_HETSC
MSDKKKEEEKKEEPKKEEKSGKDKEEKRRSKKSGKSSKKKDKKKGGSKSRKKEGIKEHHAAAAAEQPSAETKTGQTTTDALNDTAVRAYLGEAAAAVGAAEPKEEQPSAETKTGQTTTDALNDTAVRAYLGEAAAVGAAEPKEEQPSAETKTGQTTTDALNDTAVRAYLGEAAIDRQDAGQKLYKALVQLDLQQQRDKIVILALPRGGVPIAFEIAKAMRVPLDLLLVRKIGAPDNDDSAIGAIAEGLARPILDNETVAAVLLPTSTTAEQYIQQETERQMKEIERQKKTYFGEHRTPIPLDGRVAIVVDDGIATGATARAALAVLRHKNVSRIILAVPVGPPETIDQFRAEGIEVICVATPPTFNAVGSFYVNFCQTTDEEVIGCIEKAKEWMHGESRPPMRSMTPQCVRTSERLLLLLVPRSPKKNSRRPTNPPRTSDSASKLPLPSPVTMHNLIVVQMCPLFSLCPSHAISLCDNYSIP